MIITRTPFRVSFIGGGSDIPAFYQQAPGAVLSTSINQYMYISSHRYFEPDKIRAKYSRTETVSHVDELQHPIIKAVFKEFAISGGLEVSSIADVPSGTGLGSSSSFTVGLLHNLSVAKGNELNKEQLAAGACLVEIDILKEPIGKQDQYAAAYGGLNVIQFLHDGSVTVQPAVSSQNTVAMLEQRLLMFYTGDQRSASAILAEQTQNISLQSKFTALTHMVQLVHDAQTALKANRLDDFGKILHENWELKKGLAAGITNPVLNQAYEAALNAGALGGKLLGAGGGGFLLFYAPEHKHIAIRTALKSMRHFDFKFETEGSKLIHYSNEL